MGYSQLSQLISLDYKNGSTSLFNLQVTRDAEGNVTKLKYPKVNGKAGDSFKLDGCDRLEEAKMGVSTSLIDGTYQNADYDKKIAFAFDAAHNRSSDGWFVYKYDSLDRLCEVYIETYPGGWTLTPAVEERARKPSSSSWAPRSRWPEGARGPTSL